MIPADSVITVIVKGLARISFDGATVKVKLTVVSVTKDLSTVFIKDCQIFPILSEGRSAFRDGCLTEEILEEKIFFFYLLLPFH